MKRYQKLYIKRKMVTDKGKRKNMLNKVMSVENSNNSRCNFHGVSHMKYEVPLSITLLVPGYESQISYELKEDNLSWINCWSNLSL